MTEHELRRKLTDAARTWLGYSEKNGRHKEIIDLYNTQSPLPRGYKLRYTDEWCAGFVTAAGIKAGLSSIIHGECSCGQMIELYKSRGLWEEDDSYVPREGDILMYAWDDSGAGDRKTGHDHVGIVTGVTDGIISVIEGNKAEAVAYRRLTVNGRYIRGYCLPDYAGLAAEYEEENALSYEQFCEYAKRYICERSDRLAEAVTDVSGTGDEPSEWAREACEFCVRCGIFRGDGRGGFGWQRPITREQAACVIYRVFCAGTVTPDD